MKCVILNQGRCYAVGRVESIGSRVFQRRKWPKKNY